MLTQIPHIKIKNLTKIFESKSASLEAIKSLNLELEAGSFTALVGPSGCGKTTLLKLLAGLLEASEGQIAIDPPLEPAVVFQDPRLLPWYTVQKNLELALLRTQSTRLSPAEKASKIQAALKTVGLDQRQKSYPKELSGGMAQRVSLARALCREGRFMLMDEPFSALDALSRGRLQRDLKKLWLQNRPSIFFITHDIDEALFLAQRILVMKEGQIIGDFKVDPEEAPKHKESILSLMGESRTS